MSEFQSQDSIVNRILLANLRVVVVENVIGGRGQWDAKNQSKCNKIRRKETKIKQNEKKMELNKDNE